MPTDREVVITRVFDAPRRLVFEAFTTPALLKRWLEAPGRSMEVCNIDLRVGGAYRFVWRGPGQRDVGMYGTYRELAPPECIATTEAWEDWDAGESQVRTVFTERDGKTTMTSTITFPSRDVRDAVLKSGLARGAGENYDRLAHMLESMAR